MKLPKKLSYRILSYSGVLSILRELEGLGAEVYSIGKSVEGRDIHVITVGKGDLKLLAICRLHGNEPAPTNAALLFAYNLLTKRRFLDTYLGDVLDKVSVTLVPLANPDGAEEYYARFSRTPEPSWMHAFEEARVNAEGYDLNRDWLFLEQPETQALHMLVNELQPAAILDMHEFYFKGGYPPRWPDGEGEFMIALTDAPYYWVSGPIQDVSLELSKAIAAGLKENWPHWPLRERWFLGDAKAEEKPAVSPIYLGSHFPYEGCAKVLVETWGVGLGEYLLSDRVSVHALAIARAMVWLSENTDQVEEARREYFIEEEGFESATYIITGQDLDRAETILQLHGIEYARSGGKLEVNVPQRRSKMALILLDPDSSLNKKLRERGKRFTLDTAVRVKVEKSS